MLDEARKGGCLDMRSNIQSLHATTKEKKAMGIKLVVSGILSVFLSILAGTPSALAIEPFALFDDFSGARIDQGKWSGVRRPDSFVLDFAREVTGGNLRLMSRTFADPSAVPGSTGNPGRVRLQSTVSGVTQILASVRVNAVEINDCTVPTAFSEIRGRVDGYFFTTGGPPAPGDATDNIQAEVRFRRRADSVDPPGVMQLSAQVFQCGDPDCIAGSTLFNDSTTLGTLSPGQSARLALVWDPDNDRFLFLRDSLAQLTVYNYGILTDTDPPSTDLDFVATPRMEVRAQVENCASGPPASGFMDFLVDRIFVNQSAVSP
jgi:hypothetical protein